MTKSGERWSTHSQSQVEWGQSALFLVDHRRSSNEGLPTTATAQEIATTHHQQRAVQVFFPKVKARTPVLKIYKKKLSSAFWPLHKRWMQNWIKKSLEGHPVDNVWLPCRPKESFTPLTPHTQQGCPLNYPKLKPLPNCLTTCRLELALRNWEAQGPILHSVGLPN